MPDRDANSEAGAGQGGSSPPAQAHDKPQRPGDSGEVVVPGRAVPYHRFSTVARERALLKEENERLTEQLRNAHPGGAPAGAEEVTIPSVDDDPYGHAIARVERLERDRARTDKTLVQMREEEAHERRSERWQGILDREIDKHPVLQDERLNDLAQEHFWLTMTADENADPAAVVRDLAERFKGADLGGKPAPRSPKEKLAGKAPSAPREPEQSPDPGGQPVTRSPSWRERMTAAFLKNRQTRDARFQREDQRTDGL